MADSSWVLVDDRDPEISYGPSGTPMLRGGVAQEHLQTTTGLSSGNTLTYYFNASSIGVYGTGFPTGESGPPVALYQVDYTPTTTILALRYQKTEYHQEFWVSDPLPSLPPGSLHKLVVTAASPNNTVWFDYLAYLPSNNSTTSASSTTNASTSSPAFSTSTAPTGTSDSAETSDTKTNAGAIIAGAVVATVAFFLAIAALVYIRRWRPRATSRGYPKQGEVDSSSSDHSHQARSAAEFIASGIGPDEKA